MSFSRISSQLEEYFMSKVFEILHLFQMFRNQLYKLFKKLFLGWKNLNWFIRTRHDRHRRSELPIKLPSGKVKTAYHRRNSVQETQKPRNDSFLWFTNEPKIHKFMFWGEYYKYSLHINRLSIKEDKGDIVERSINSFNSSPFLEMTPRSNEIYFKNQSKSIPSPARSQAEAEFSEPWKFEISCKTIRHIFAPRSVQFNNFQTKWPTNILFSPLIRHPQGKSRTLIS